VPRDWDAATYDRLPVPMTAWGEAVVGRLELAGDERVLDAGCGTGQVTEKLLERLPRGNVIALDGSPSMIQQARRRLGDERIDYVVADLLHPLPIDAPVDAILSTATFHWVPDHDRLFANLAAVLRPDGQLVAQCGGAGNIADIDLIVRELGFEAASGKVFPTSEETTERLRAAGFVDIECWLHDEPTTLRADDLEPYLRAVCLGGVVEGMADAERDALVRAVVERMPGPTIHYVRLDIQARRKAARSHNGSTS
jgi:trans-aconitate 2-methyltransferase